MNEPTFQQLKKLAKNRAGEDKAYRIAILGDCATQHIATAVRGYGAYAQLPLEIFDADYNQIFSQIADPESELYRFGPQAVLILMCAEKLYEGFCAAPLQKRETFAQDTFAVIQGYWQMLAGRNQASVLQCNFVQINDGCFGNYAGKTQSSFLFQLHKLNGLLMTGCQEYKNVFPVDLNSIQADMGRQSFHDPKLYYIAKMPISLQALPFVAKAVVDVVRVLLGGVKKCVVLDLDNTLWGGVIGDDGINGIQIGELGLGHAFSEFQLWLKELKNRGILLAVCSKNNEDTAKEPFEKHPEMVLRLEDFSMFVANWEDKARNIRTIQQTLNIGMDSLVFLDDNPFERDVVRSLIPQITVPDLPEDPALYLEYVRGLNLFETASYSAEDSKRTQQYRQAADRTMLEASFGSYDDYLQSLEMEAEAESFDEFHFPRIAQLTQRSNQFNLRTVRHTEAQIAALAQSDRHITRRYCLKDKFGDYGLISVVVMDKQEAEDTLFISQWLMSCRVLKRGMEEFIINDILATAKQAGFRYVVGEYIKTPKNAMVADIYTRMGFREQDGMFIADTDQFENNKTYIRRTLL